MSHTIQEVNGTACADEIQRFNSAFKKDFLPLKPRHLTNGFWWLVYSEGKLVGFAGMVPMEPFAQYGYLKRAAVLPEWRRKGIQRDLMALREEKARAATDWTHLISECALENVTSANNHIAAGYRLVEVERPWAKDTLFWLKKLEREG